MTSTDDPGNIVRLENLTENSKVLFKMVGECANFGGIFHLETAQNRTINPVLAVDSGIFILAADSRH